MRSILFFLWLFVAMILAQIQELIRKPESVVKPLSLINPSPVSTLYYTPTDDRIAVWIFESEDQIPFCTACAKKESHCLYRQPQAIYHLHTEEAKTFWGYQCFLCSLVLTHNGWTEIALFAIERQEWLEEFEIERLMKEFEIEYQL